MKAFNFIAVACLFLASCRSIPPVNDTGIGRAWDQAWYGTPPEVVSSIQFLHSKLQEEWLEKYTAIEESNVLDKNGQINVQAAQNRFRDLEALNAQLDSLERLCEALALYHGITLTEPAQKSMQEANKKRKQFWSNIQSGAAKVGKEIINE